MLAPLTRAWAAQLASHAKPRPSCFHTSPLMALRSLGSLESPGCPSCALKHRQIEQTMSHCLYASRCFGPPGRMTIPGTVPAHPGPVLSCLLRALRKDSLWLCPLLLSWSVCPSGLCSLPLSCSPSHFALLPLSWHSLPLSLSVSFTPISLLLPVFSSPLFPPPYSFCLHHSVTPVLSTSPSHPAFSSQENLQPYPASALLGSEA